MNPSLWARQIPSRPAKKCRSHKPPSQEGRNEFPSLSPPKPPNLQARRGHYRFREYALARRLHGRTKLSPPRGGSSGNLQRGRRLEAGPAERSEHRRELVGTVSGLSTECPRTTGRRLEPEPESCTGAIHSGPRAGPLLPRRSLPHGYRGSDRKSVV